jgi:hypothetical protein
MSEPVDIVGHSISAGGGAVLTLILDRVIRFFTERDRRREELELIAKLAKIESQLEQLLKSAERREELASLIARLDERVKSVELKVNQ